ALEAAIDDQQAHDVSGKVYHEDDREDQRIRHPDPEVQSEPLYAGIEPRAVDDGGEQQHRDRHERGEPHRHQSTGRAAEEDGDLGSAVESSVEAMTRLGHETELARNAAVERIQDLPDRHEYERGDDAARGEGDRRRKARPE